MVDSDRFRQVIFNLIGNAVKFTSRGCITVSARCTEVNNQYADVQLVVTDTGIGIPENRISRLFEAFEQCDSSTTRDYGGTGLGLAICKQIIDLMGGEIHVESTEGVGSEFTIEIRLLFATPANEDFECAHATEYFENQLCVAVIGMSNPISKLLQETLVAYNIDTSFFEEDEVMPQGKFNFIFFNCDCGPESVFKMLAQQPALKDDDAPILIPIVPANCVVEQQDWESLGVRQPLHKPWSQTRLLQALDSKQADDEQVKTNRLPLRKFQDGVVRILLCEDVPVNQMFASEVCRNSGIECVVCDNGKVAIETLKNDSQFDVIFMDCQMPVMDGFEATQIIREMNKSGLIPAIPIVAMTANAVSGDREKCLAAGMDDYLTKPFEIGPFLDQIHTHAAISPATQINTVDNIRARKPIFNQHELVGQFNDEAFAIQLATKFANSLPTYQADLQTSLEEQDVAKTLSVTHRLRGSAGTVWAERILYLAIEMESAAGEGQLDQLESQFVEMLQEFENFATAVRHESSNNSDC